MFKILNVRNISKFNQIRAFGSFGDARRSLSLGGENYKEKYFYKQLEKQLKQLKEKRITEKEFIAERVKQHEEALQYHRRMLKKFKLEKMKTSRS